MVHIDLKYILFVFLISLNIINLSCSDFGVLPPKYQLIASSNDVTVLKAATVEVDLSGGLAPYSIRTQPNNLIATVSLVSATLNITGVDTGYTFMVVQDSKSPKPDTVQIQIHVVLTIPVSFANDIQPIFNSNCVGCHGGSGGLTLTAGASYDQLVNVLAQSSCTVMYRVLPHQATNSVLYRKVTGTSCGNTMPLGGSLTTTQINLIRDWINQGAPR